GMQDGRRRWIAGLRAGAADPKDLEPARLYEIVAQTGALETDLSGLSALLGPPAIQGCWIGFRTTGWTSAFASPGMPSKTRPSSSRGLGSPADPRADRAPAGP